jgi:hypothetical protein
MGPGPGESSTKVVAGDGKPMSLALDVRRVRGGVGKGYDWYDSRLVYCVA